MNKIQKALQGLLKKYDILFNPDLNMLPGWMFIHQEIGEKDIPLQCWRSNRKFVELHKLTLENVVEHVCMLRFCRMTDSKRNLASLLYQEFDLCEFIGLGKIISLHAVFSNDRGGNVIVKLDNGVICSVEISNEVPVGCSIVERHEIIARRGVASDIVVDTQIPQQSIYTYTKQGNDIYKDIDNELFGLKECEIEQVRASFDLLKDISLKEQCLQQHKHLLKLVDYAFLSDRESRKINID